MDEKDFKIEECLNLSCERNAFQEYPSGTRINKGLQCAILNNCTKKTLVRILISFFAKKRAFNRENFKIPRTFLGKKSINTLFFETGRGSLFSGR